MDNPCCHVPFATCLKFLCQTIFIDSFVLTGKLSWGLYFLTKAITEQLHYRNNEYWDDLSESDVAGYYAAAIFLLGISFLKLISNVLLHRNAKKLWISGDDCFSNTRLFSDNVCTGWKTWLTVAILSILLNIAILWVESVRYVMVNIVIAVIFTIWEVSILFVIALLRLSLQNYFNKRQRLVTR